MGGRRSRWRCAVALTSALLLLGCSGESFSDAERATIASMSLAALPPLPADPTNKYADDPAAAALGATLFFDQRMSIDGVVACGTCHLIDRQFQDDLPRGRGVGVTNRRTMPLAGVAWGPWFFWDGRRDSLWAQALTPLEDQREHAATRAFYAHFVAENFNERYQRIFGPLPDLSSVPRHAGPFGRDAEKAAWASMSPEQQDGVNRVFANLGKAIAAFERSIVPEETRFDRFAKAMAAGEKPDRGCCVHSRGGRRPEAVHRQGELFDLPHRPAADRRFFPQHRRSRRRRSARGSRHGRPERKRLPPIPSTAWANSAMPGRKPAASCASW